MIYPKVKNVRIHMPPGQHGVRVEHLRDEEYVLIDTFLVLWKKQHNKIIEARAARVGEHKDFTTDFASIPRMLRVLFPTNGRNAEAAVAHDYFYQFAHVLDISRYEADKLFHKLLRLAKVNLISAYAQFVGVRVGGWVVWMRHPGRTWKSAL